jgi:FAD/FMN-containing dehydrogenase
MIDYLMSSNSPMRAAQIRPLGGAMARVPEDSTAYPYRQVPLMLNLVSFYTDPEDRMVKENWLADFARDIDQGVPGVYSNFLGDEGADRLHQAYPAKTWGRLAEIKTRYDPTNLFHRNHNIPPITDR